MKLGIVGMPNVGKSTLFNAITNAGAQSANYPFCTIEPNVGMVAVPDARLDYLAFALLIWAGLDGILNNIPLPEKSNVNLFTASPKDLWGLETLPLTRSNAAKVTLSSDFIKTHLPESLINFFCER